MVSWKTPPQTAKRLRQKPLLYAGAFVMGQNNMAKAFAKKFYSSKQWQDCRNEYARKRHHLCENCLRKGIYRPGEIVHHKIEIDPITIENPEIALKHDNLELLCRECHAQVHDNHSRWDKVNRERREKKIRSQRYKVDDMGRVTAR